MQRSVWSCSMGRRWILNDLRAIGWDVRAVGPAMRGPSKGKPPGRILFSYPLLSEEVSIGLLLEDRPLKTGR